MLPPWLAVLRVSLAVVATVLPAGLWLLFLLRGRIKNFRLPAIGILMLSVAASSALGWYTYTHGAPSPGRLHMLDALIIPFASFLSQAVVASVCPPYFCQTGSRLYAFTRPGNRELLWGGAITAGAALLGMYVCLRLADLVGVAFAMFRYSIGMYMWRFLGRIEIHTRGIVREGAFYPWRSLGKFDWTSGVLCIQRLAGAKEIRIAYPEDSTVETILTAHGLERC